MRVMEYYMNIINDLRAYIEVLKREGEIIFIDTPVDPCLEIAEIHRRVIEKGGPALFFSNIQGSTFPVVTNLFGTERRIDLAFGKRPVKFVNDTVKFAERLLPPDMHKLLSGKGIFMQGLKIGTIFSGARRASSSARSAGVPMTTPMTIFSCTSRSSAAAAEVTSCWLHL